MADRCAVRQTKADNSACNLMPGTAVKTQVNYRKIKEVALAQKHRTWFLISACLTQRHGTGSRMFVWIDGIRASVSHSNGKLVDVQLPNEPSTGHAVSRNGHSKHRQRSRGDAVASAFACRAGGHGFQRPARQGFQENGHGLSGKPSVQWTWPARQTQRSMDNVNGKRHGK